MNKDSLITEIKDFLFPIIALIILFFLIILFLLPKVSEVLSLRSENHKQLEKINKLSQKLADLQTLSEAELFDSANLLLEALPGQKDFYKVLRIIRETAPESDLVLESFKFSPGIVSTEAASLANPNAMKFSLTFTAPFSGLKKFLESLERSLPIISIETLKLTSPVSSVSASMLVEGKMEIKSHVSSLSKNLGEVEKPLAKISSQHQTLIEELKSYHRFQFETVPVESVVVGKENPF